MTPRRSLELVAPAPEPPAAGTPAGRSEIQVVRGADGHSRVSRAYATSPLRVLTPVNHGAAAWIYTSSYGGGLVDGDAVSLEIAIDRGASAFVSTQASTKVYPSVRGTQSRLQASVAPDALLVFAPDPVVCFAGARYQQSQSAVVAPGGALALVDWVTSGRRASGERWRFEEYVSRTEVVVGGRAALRDTLSLRAAHGDLQARMGRFDVLALVVLAGAPLDEAARRVLTVVAETPVSRRAAILLSAAPLRTGGCAVRIAGPSVEQVGAVIERMLDFVPALLGDNPWSRKW